MFSQITLKLGRQKQGVAKGRWPGAETTEIAEGVAGKSEKNSACFPEKALIHLSGHSLTLKAAN